MCNTEEGKRLTRIKGAKVKKIRISKKTKPFGIKLK